MFWTYFSLYCVANCDALEIGQMLLERNQILSAKIEEFEADPASVVWWVKIAASAALSSDSIYIC